MIFLIVYVLSSGALIAARHYGVIDNPWHAVSFPLWGPLSMLIALMVVNVLPNWMLSMGYKPEPTGDNMRSSFKFYHHWIGRIKVVKTLLNVTWVDASMYASVEGRASGLIEGILHGEKGGKKLKHRTAKRFVERGSK